MGGFAHFQAVASPPDGKAILTVNADLSIDRLEFSGAVVPDGNGAGIRYQAGDLVIANSWFHDNENGLLGAASVGGTISIDRSEFNDNGNGTGFTHNIYVGTIERLSVTNSYFHDVDTGHEIKSRALTNVISFNRIADGPDESASYSINLPNGGVNSIIGNVIEKGLIAQNWTFVAQGEEGSIHDPTSLLIQDNVFINNMASGTPNVVRSFAAAAPEITGNTFYGIAEDQLSDGTVLASDNIFLGLPGPAIDTSAPFDSLSVAVAEPGATVMLLGALALAAYRRRSARRGAHAAVMAG